MDYGEKIHWNTWIITIKEPLKSLSERIKLYYYQVMIWLYLLLRANSIFLIIFNSNHLFSENQNITDFLQSV